MVSRQKLLLAAIAATFTGFALPSFAEDHYITIDPPARRVEKYEMRTGHVWVPGAWHWRNGKHEWVAGHHVAERKGYRYAPDRWVMHDEGKWTYQRGGWNRDSDGDGVPDRLDRAPLNPTRH
ncbi:MAG: hypothetical protein ABI789_01415 [Usitatibacter sp.]